MESFVQNLYNLYCPVILTLYVLYTAKGTAKVNPTIQADAITIFAPNSVRRVSVGNTIAVKRSYETAHKLNTAVINRAPTKSTNKLFNFSSLLNN